MHYIKTGSDQPFNLKSVPVSNVRVEAKVDSITAVQKTATTTASKQDLLAGKLIAFFFAIY